jgi:hypothetical protein
LRCRTEGGDVSDRWKRQWEGLSKLEVNKSNKKEDAMKKASWLVVLLAVVALVMIPVVAGAQEVKHAVVIKTDSCLVVDLHPPFNDPPFTTFEVPDSVKVVTQSRNLNKNVSCHGDLSDGSSYENTPPKQAVTYDYENTGWQCCVNFDGVWASTLQWHETITPSGNVSLTCHFKGNEPTTACCPEGQILWTNYGVCCYPNVEPVGGVCPN